MARHLDQFIKGKQNLTQCIKTLESLDNSPEELYSFLSRHIFHPDHFQLFCDHPDTMGKYIELFCSLANKQLLLSYHPAFLIEQLGQAIPWPACETLLDFLKFPLQPDYSLDLKLNVLPPSLYNFDNIPLLLLSDDRASLQAFQRLGNYWVRTYSSISNRFVGRVLIFLSFILPTTDKSALNIRARTSKVEIPEHGSSSSFFDSFWSIQKVLIEEGPSSDLFKDISRFENLIQQIEHIASLFRKNPLLFTGVSSLPVHPLVFHAHSLKYETKDNLVLEMQFGLESKNALTPVEAILYRTSFLLQLDRLFVYANAFFSKGAKESTILSKIFNSKNIIQDLLRQITKTNSYCYTYLDNQFTRWKRSGCPTPKIPKHVDVIQPQTQLQVVKIVQNLDAGNPFPFHDETRHTAPVDFNSLQNPLKKTPLLAKNNFFLRSALRHPSSWDQTLLNQINPESSATWKDYNPRWSFSQTWKPIPPWSPEDLSHNKSSSSTPQLQSTPVEIENNRDSDIVASFKNSKSISPDDSAEAFEANHMNSDLTQEDLLDLEEEEGG